MAYTRTASIVGLLLAGCPSSGEGNGATDTEDTGSTGGSSITTASSSTSASGSASGSSTMSTSTDATDSGTSTGTGSETGPSTGMPETTGSSTDATGSSSTTGAVEECTVGGTVCDGACVNTENDPAHCGGCGNDCMGDPCEAGDCQPDGCQNAPEECNGACTNTDIDPLNCGNCGEACAADELCENGNCQQYEIPRACDACPCDECVDQFDQCCEWDALGGDVVCVDSSSCP